MNSMNDNDITNCKVYRYKHTHQYIYIMDNVLYVIIKCNKKNLYNILSIFIYTYILIYTYIYTYILIYTSKHICNQ